MHAQSQKDRSCRTSGRSGSSSRVPSELSELMEVSRAVGGDPDMVQGGGGNTSVKARNGKVMFVKASGAALVDLDATRGWAEMDLVAVRGVLEKEGLVTLSADARESEVLRLLQAAVLRPRGARPSVEASLHAILDRVVIHVHPVHLNAFLCSRDSREKYLGLFDDLARNLGQPPLYVPYVDPGYTLAARLALEIGEYRSEHGRLPAVVLLENHGVFVGAEDPGAAIQLTRRVTELGKNWAGGDRVNPMPVPEMVEVSDVRTGAVPGLAELRGALMRGGCTVGVLRRDDSPIAREFLSRPELLVAARQGAFTPDQIVYCRTHPLVLDGESASDWDAAVAAYRQRYGLDPRVLLRAPSGGRGMSGALARGAADSLEPTRRDDQRGGVFYAAGDFKQLRVVGEVYRGALVAILRNDRGGGPRFLNEEQAGFIEGWEVEHYRSAVLQGGGKRLAGRIGAVTGAASGLGRAIALGLAEAGATVFALDINREALEAVRKSQPGVSYLPLVADVTSEESIARCFREIEASAGGLDYLVNAAGIAPPFPLVDFPFAAWKKTLEINLTGYFLCAREAARLLLRQNAGGSIVNLTSKSGLEASKDNSAYNATKAGEIHLMRGWALELGRQGIRVNCVAPGNVFKGSQIWNEEYIKACAKKKGIKPEEVIPYYNSLTALGQEIEPRDIADAVVFLVSDQARRITGQTLVVDGGQVMVR